MAVTWAINCRGTLGFVSDVAPEVLEDGSTGWLDSVLAPVALGGADRNNSVDRRLAGIIYKDNNNSGQCRKDFTIPSAGTYVLRVALGDHASSQTNQALVVSDTATPLVTLAIPATGAAEFADAAGTLRSLANWPTLNTGVTVTFATTTLRVLFGTVGGDGGFTTLAHLSLEPVGGPVGGAFNQVIFCTRGWRRWR